MKWNNVAPDISATPLESLTASWSAIDVIKLLNLTQSEPFVIISDSVRRKINNHITKKKTELGGLLLGRVFSPINLKVGIVAIEVTDSIESRIFDSTHVSLCMDSNVWQLATEQAAEEAFVVGWYHSHPNLGAFFSGTDRKTQQDFFSHNYSIGLVIDPIREEEQWFLGKNSIELIPAHILKSRDDFTSKNQS